MKKWEYKIERKHYRERDCTDIPEHQDFLNGLGKKGWELVDTIRNHDYHIIIYYFKRLININPSQRY